MKKSVKQEIQELIEKEQLNCLIEEFKDEVDWYWISAKQKLSEEFIREFKNEVNWHCISCYQKLSEDFIREFQDQVSWILISAYQKLSEDFIREFEDKLNWDYISFCQKLSEEFKVEFKDKSEELKTEFKEKIFNEEYKIPYGPIMMGGHTSDISYSTDFPKELKCTFIPEVKEENNNIAKNRFELMDL